MEKVSVEEAIQFAISQEIQAANLYESLLSQAKDPRTTELFAELRDMEIQHRENLEAFDILAFRKRHDEQPLLDLKLTDYLVEQDPNAELNYQETLILAAQREQKTFAMYTAMAMRFEYDDTLKNLFTLLAREEMLHKDQIESLYDDTVLNQN